MTDTIAPELEPAADQADLDAAYARVLRQAEDVHFKLQAQLPNWVVQGPDNVDHPGMFIARLWTSIPEPRRFDMILRADTLESLRRVIPRTAVKFMRSEGDDPSIVEVWI